MSVPRAEQTADPFLRRFLERVPADIAGSFTPAQLDAVKLAFAARSWGEHAVDIRRVVGAGRWRFYIVLLAGRTRREADGLGSRLLVLVLGSLFAALRRVFAVFLIAGALTAVAVGGFGVLYTAKRALHIDVVAGVEMLPDRIIENLLR
jgi:hypothetical protein